MSLKTVSTDKAPAAIGPYSQAIVVGDLVFTSGQISINPKTGELVSGDIATQTKQALDNIGAVLEASGASLGSVIKTTLFIKDMNDFKTINTIYGEYFKEPYPARSCVEVAKLPKDAGIEIEAVAVIKK